MADPKKTTDDEIKKLIAAIPAGGSTSQLQPIGVPPVSAHVDAHGVATAVPFTSASGVPVRYYEGDDWAPANASPQDIAQVQQQLVAAGLLPSGSQYHAGVWDEVTRTAFRGALTYANASGLDASAALNVLASTKRTTVLQPHLVPDIATVAQTVKQTIQQKLGRDVTPEEMPHLASVLLGFDNNAVAASDAAAGAAPGSAVPAVDPTAEFQQYLDTTYKPEIQRTAGVTDLSQNREKLMSSIFSLDKQMANGA